MIGDITRNLVEQFSDNFGSGNNISYASGGVRYSDRGAGAPPIVGIVTAGEKLSKSYSPAKLIRLKVRCSQPTLIKLRYMMTVGMNKTHLYYIKGFSFPVKQHYHFNTIIVCLLI